ncbi:MAG: 5'-nucleotidase C-terminal domain-containing protein [Oscillospiraceae bacterium]|nr:5'-nucleotidase C-terminal domain-containing protein [Oscillospiraceae bacterium]
MKKMSRILSVILAICMVVSLMPSVWATENADTVEILLLDTSDIHGQLYATNYTNDYAQSGTNNQGLTRVATYIKQMRAQYENVFLADTGDTIQGTPLTYYFAFEEDTMADPTVKAMRTLGYDMWVLGNHEFNYGMKILTEQVDYATAEATENETPITMSMANYLAAETNSDESKDWATWRGFEPYVIKEYDGVKIAIMGIGNPGVPQWDVPENWEGIYFANPIETYDHYEAEMLEKADMIVLMSHSGIDIEGDGTGYIRQLIQTHDSVDLVFSGHEHRDGVTKIADKAGRIIPVISPSTKCAKIGQALITYNKADGSYTIDAKNVSMKNYALDEELVNILKPYEEATWNDYMLQPIGTASGDFSARGLGDGPSAFMDLINQVQLAYAYDYNGQNTPDDPTDDQMAQLSISAPLTSGNAANIINKGDIVLGDMFKLYRYENWFYQITMTGKEVRTWLEFAATNVRPDGTATNLTYYDVIYGDGFYYEINAKAPEGKRITKMTYNGVDVADDQIFTVVVNNYRYNGGGNYVKYLNDHGVPFEANDPDRIIYSTQYDMIQGEDNGQARNMLANYIREKGTIDPTITSTWKITTELPASFEFAVVTTTDMHGRSTEYDVATQKLDNNSMLKAATIIKDIRAAYGDDMLLLDNGDTIQGNLVAQYAINQKSDVLNPMMEIMIDLGYDTWTMGNHEFNFNPTQRDTQAQFALESGMSALAANITLLTDGKNMFGEDAKAGDPFYAPYVVKTLTDDFGREVKIAVIGMGNPANATWDLASNYPNMQFSSLENPNGDLAYEFQKWIDIVNEKEDVDVIVIASHNGTGNEKGSSLENQSLYAAMNSAGADLVITGHDHTATIRTAENKNGETVYIANAGGANVNLNTVTVTFGANGEVADVAIASENIALADAAVDAELAARSQHWFDETYAWASAPVGTFAGGWTELAPQFTGKTNNQMVTFQNALVDFVHKGQIWASWQSYEELGIEGATVSIGSAVFAEDWSNGGALGFVPVDGTTISTLELNKLYRYSNNLLCAIDLTGAELWNWMNTVANYYDVDENGNIYLNSSVFGTDTFYGVDYIIDLTKPYGERLVKATYQGQDLKTYDGLIRCALNSYRLSGGYGFFEATGKTEADCAWTASMYLGSDRAPVPTQLGEYVAHMGTVTPNDAVSHGADTTWTIITEAAPEAEVLAEGWSGYTTWVLTSDGVLTFSPSDQLFNGKCNMKNYWKVNGELTLPWGDYAEIITKVVVEDGIHAVGQMAFYGLPNLKEVVLADSVWEIRNYAFKNCTSLTTVDASGVEMFREGAFYGCSSLNDVTFNEFFGLEDWAFSKTLIKLYP